MKRENLIPFIKWGIYYLALLIAYTLQTTSHLFEISGIKPVLIVPLLICVCMYEEVVPSFVYAVITGLLWDISSGKLMGFNAIILSVVGMFASLLCIYYLRTKLLNSVLFVITAMMVQGLLDFLFYYALWGLENNQLILTNYILPTVIYTVVVTPIFYFGVRLAASKFNSVVRI